MKKRPLIIVAIIIVACLAFVLAHTLWLKQPDGTRAPEISTPPVQQPDSRTQVPAAPKDDRKEPAKGQMELETKQSYESTASGDFDETIRVKKKEIKITPGVVFESGKGVSIKPPGEEEKIVIRRDNTYRDGEYRVQWEKKF